MTNGFSHCYQLDESTFNSRGFGSNMSFLFHFSMKIMKANRIAPDGTPRFAPSHLGLFCLPMSHKKDAIRLIWDNETYYFLSEFFTFYTIFLIVRILGNVSKYIHLFFKGHFCRS